MKSAHWLLIGIGVGIGAVILYKMFAKKQAVQGFGDFNVQPTPPPWYNVGVQPMGYEPTGWQPYDEWKNFAKRREQLRAQGLGEYAPGTAYPLAVNIASAPIVSPYAMPYQPATPVSYATINWKAPRINAFRFDDETDPF